MRRNYLIAGVVVLVVIAAIVIIISRSNNGPGGSCTDVTNAQPTVTAAELKIQVTRTCATGAEAKVGSTISVNYVGRLKEGGTQFDSSFNSGGPFTFQLGAGKVIQGWDQGLVGMKVGEKRTLTIPPSLGYGPQGAPPKIPGNATLVFDVELVSVK